MPLELSASDTTVECHSRVINYATKCIINSPRGIIDYDYSTGITYDRNMLIVEVTDRSNGL